MRKFQCLLFVLKRSYICYYIICMTVPLSKQSDAVKNAAKKNVYNAKMKNVEDKIPDINY